ncbi:hypothetical protein SDJN02_02775, partial [Cucurbita argyrosperma subsp. argyrosperma]
MSTPRRSPPSTGNRASSDAAPEPLTQSQKNQLQVHFTDEDELDLLNCYLEFPGNGVWREGLKGMEEWSLKGMNEKWVLLHIEEAE